MSSQELEPAGSVELVQFEDAKALAELLSGLAQASEPTEEELEAMRFSIILEMASAETEADMWKELPTWSSKNNIDVAFEIRDARAWRSKFESKSGKRGAFLSCPAVALDPGRSGDGGMIATLPGELGILNTSAMRLCGRIGWYKIHGQLPVKLRVVKVGDSGAGYPILDARRLEEPVDTSEQAGGPSEEVIEDAELVDA